MPKHRDRPVARDVGRLARIAADVVELVGAVGGNDELVAAELDGAADARQVGEHRLRLRRLARDQAEKTGALVARPGGDAGEIERRGVDIDRADGGVDRRGAQPRRPDRQRHVQLLAVE